MSYSDTPNSLPEITISEVATNWHALMIPQRTMRPSIARASKQLDPQSAASRHTTTPISITKLYGHSVAHKLLLISCPTEGKRLSWPEHAELQVTSSMDHLHPQRHLGVNNLPRVATAVELAALYSLDLSITNLMPEPLSHRLMGTSLKGNYMYNAVKRPQRTMINAIAKLQGWVWQWLSCLPPEMHDISRFIL